MARGCIGPSLAASDQLVGSGLGIFCKRIFVCRAHHCACCHCRERPIGTDEEEEQRRSGIMDGFRYVRSKRPVLSMIMLIALQHDLCIFPHHLRDAAALCSQRPALGPDSSAG